MDLRQFEVRMKKLGSNVETNADKLMRKVALSVDSTLVSATPVDTGRARSNWVAELGGPAAFTNPPMSADEAMADAKAVIEQYKGGTDIHLTNNLPYIGALNDGHSAQAPAGFVQTAVLDGVAQIPGTKLLE